MTATAIILSVLALVLSAASLSWQAWSWSRSGPVLRVDVTNAITDGETAGVPDHYVCVEVVNYGRAAATVGSWGIEMPDKTNLVVLAPHHLSERLPARVESHASARFVVLAEHLRRRHAETGDPFEKMRPWVSTSAGKRVYSRKSVPLA